VEARAGAAQIEEAKVLTLRTKLLLAVATSVIVANGMVFFQDLFWSNALQDAKTSDMDLYGVPKAKGSCGRWVTDNLRRAGLRLPTKSNLTRRTPSDCYYSNGVPWFNAMLLTFA
jgi:hypothetical protein